MNKKVLSQIEKIESSRLVLPNYHHDLRNHEKCFEQKILFAAKGPSLDSINNFLNFGEIATVNEACLKIPCGIDYAFFLDYDALENSRSAWERIKNFIMPPFLFGKKINSKPVSIKKIKGIPIHRVSCVNINQDEFNPEHLEKKIKDNILVTVDTAIMGLHFLAMRGYKHIFLIGHDGGFGYASGIPCIHKERDMQKFRDKIEHFIKIMKKFHKVKVEFYDSKKYFEV